jgi:hypothetical protein
VAARSTTKVWRRHPLIVQKAVRVILAIPRGPVDAGTHGLAMPRGGISADLCRFTII